MSHQELLKGSFVKIDGDIGVVVGLGGENNIPEEHLGIWYGQTTENNIPLYCTVPEEYCIKLNDSESFH